MSKNIALKAVTAAQLRLGGWRNTAAARIASRADDGQTSVEYLGIIAVVAAIVVVIIGTNLGNVIYSAILTQVAKVAK